MKIKKLNLGCGRKFKEGFINIDFEDFSYIGNNFMQLDLEKPLPFKDNSIDEVYCESCLEHIFNFYQLINEIYRVCKPDAKVTFLVPHFTNNTSEFHIRPFRYNMLRDYCKGYKKAIFDKRYFYHIKRKITFKSVYSFMNFINIHHFFIKLYEYSFLRSLFFAHAVIFEARIYKEK